MAPSPISSDAYSRSEEINGDPFSKTKVDLKMAAKQKKALQIREQNHEIEEVAILASDPAKEATKHDFKRIEEKLEDKRERHDKAYKGYKQQLRDTSDHVETYYVTEAERIKESLNSIDTDIRSVFEELDKDEILEMQVSDCDERKRNMYCIVIYCILSTIFFSKGHFLFEGRWIFFFYSYIFFFTQHRTTDTSPRCGRRSTRS